MKPVFAGSRGGDRCDCRTRGNRGPFRGSDALLDEIAIGGRGEAAADLEQPAKGAVQVAAAVRAEHELVEVALDAAFAQPAWRNPRKKIAAEETTGPVSSHRDHGV